VSLTAGVNGSVALDPPGGVYEPGTRVTLTATPAAGRSFASWDGDLTGSANPTSVVVDRNLQVMARFRTPVALEELESGSSADAATATTTAPLAAVTGDLYLAAMAFKPHVGVTGVAGLGLQWTPLRAQCAGRGQTGVAIWQARGQPTLAGAVTATFASVPQNAVLAVSRYSGAGALGTAGAVSANSLGLAGACSSGEDQDAYAFQLPATTPGGLAYVAAAMRHRAHLPGSGYVERLEIYRGSAGSVAGLALADLRIALPGATPVAGHFGGVVDWAGVAFEIPTLPPAP
jgi:hypothetical protein